MMTNRILIAPLVLCLLAGGCLSGTDDEPVIDDAGNKGSNNGGNSSLDPDVDPVTTGNWYRPEVDVDWHWQLQGQVDTSYDVELWDLDLFEAPDSLIDELHNDNRKVICYFSAGTAEDFRDDIGILQESDMGDTLPDYDDERWLDIRSPRVLELALGRLDYAVERGCDGVEPDNVDAWDNNIGFDLTLDDQLAFNRAVANGAHERGLSVALKNALGQIPQMVDYYDFALNEQCHEYDECDQLQPFLDASKPVLNAEYDDDADKASEVADDLCDDSNAMGLRTLVLPIDLDGTFRETCNN